MRDSSMSYDVRVTRSLRLYSQPLSWPPTCTSPPLPALPHPFPSPPLPGVQASAPSSSPRRATRLRGIGLCRCLVLSTQGRLLNLHAHERKLRSTTRLLHHHAFEQFL